jgi:hypothetical protein
LSFSLVPKDLSEIQDLVKIVEIPGSASGVHSFFRPYFAWLGERQNGQQRQRERTYQMARGNISEMPPVEPGRQVSARVFCIGGCVRRVGNKEAEKPAVADDAGGDDTTFTTDGQVDATINASSAQSTSVDEESKGWVWKPTRTAAMEHAERHTKPRRWVRVGSGASTGAIGTGCRR